MASFKDDFRRMISEAFAGSVRASSFTLTSEIKDSNKRLIEEFKSSRSLGSHAAVQNRERELIDARNEARGHNQALFRERQRAVVDYRREAQRYGPSHFSKLDEFATSHAQRSYTNFYDLDRDFRQFQRTGEAPTDKKKGRSFAEQQALAAAAGAVSHSFGTVANHVPVVGPAVSSGVGVGLNALAMGASGALAAGLGTIVAGGAAVAGSISSSYNQYAADEALLQRLGRVGGISGARSAMTGLQQAGYLNSEIGAVGVPLAQATGGFHGIDTVAQLQHTYGLGGNAVGMLGGMAQTGASRDQTRAVREAISAGMQAGLERGRFHEMVDGMNHLIRRSALGVTVDAESASQGSMLALALGKGTGIRGNQLMGMMGSMDQAVKGRGSTFLSRSLSFMTAYDHLSNSGKPFDVVDVEKLQERGIMGKGGMGAAGVANYLAKTITTFMGGVAQAQQDADKAAKGDAAARSRLNVLDKQINAALLDNSSLAAAEKLRTSYLGNPDMFDEKALKEALSEGDSKQEKAYDEIITQTNIMRQIEYNTEAYGRLSVGGDQDKWNYMVASVSSKVAGTKSPVSAAEATANLGSSWAWWSDNDAAARIAYGYDDEISDPSKGLFGKDPESQARLKKILWRTGDGKAGDPFNRKLDEDDFAAFRTSDAAVNDFQALADAAKGLGKAATGLSFVDDATRPKLNTAALAAEAGLRAAGAGSNSDGVAAANQVIADAVSNMSPSERDTATVEIRRMVDGLISFLRRYETNEDLSFRANSNNTVHATDMLNATLGTSYYSTLLDYGYSNPGTPVAAARK